MRRAYRCSCDGQSHRAQGEEPGPLAASVRGELAAIESEHGERPHECPWRAYAERDVIAVLHAHDWWDSGQCAEEWGPDPEWWLVEATRYFHRALETSRAAVDKLRRDQPVAPKPLLGQVVERGRL